MPLHTSPKERIRRLLPRRCTSHRILFGPLRGARIVTSWHDYPGAILGRTERPLLAWFGSHVRESESWLDVGAHFGYTAIALCRRVGPRGRVFAFEPVLATAGCIARTREINRLAQLRVVPLGVDRNPNLRSTELPVTRGMADSTLSASTCRERILTVSLDALWPSLHEGNPRIDGIKIDVQGMELEALLGMQNILLEWSPALVIEFHAGVDRPAILDLLQRCGYSPACEPIDRGSNTLEDDRSYVFTALPCASLSTPSSIART